MLCYLLSLRSKFTFRNELNFHAQQLVKQLECLLECLHHADLDERSKV